jgi:hypothetical protein
MYQWQWQVDEDHSLELIHRPGSSHRPLPTCASHLCASRTDDFRRASSIIDSSLGYLSSSVLHVLEQEHHARLVLMRRRPQDLHTREASAP